MTFSAIFALGLLAATGQAPEHITSVNIGDQKVTITDQRPPAMAGRYLYEKNGEPIIELNADGTGIFQPHDVPGIPIHYWLLANADGTPVRQNGEGNPNYRYTVVLQYGPGGGGNYPENGYDMWNWDMDVANGCAIILGERFKCQ